MKPRLKTQKKAGKAKKIKVNLAEWTNLVEIILKQHKNQFGLGARLQRIFKKNLPKAEIIICKLLIQKMEQKKLSYLEAQQIALSNHENLKVIQKDLPKVLTYFLGSGAMLLMSIIFLILRFPKPLVLSDFNLLFWSFLIILNGIFFYLGWKKRNKFEKHSLRYSFLAQSAASFAYARSPGKGGSLFEAYQYLDLLQAKNKQAFDRKFGLSKKR